MGRHEDLAWKRLHTATEDLRGRRVPYEREERITVYCGNHPDYPHGVDAAQPGNTYGRPTARATEGPAGESYHVTLEPPSTPYPKTIAMSYYCRAKYNLELAFQGVQEVDVVMREQQFIESLNTTRATAALTARVCPGLAFFRRMQATLAPPAGRQELPVAGEESPRAVPLLR